MVLVPGMGDLRAGDRFLTPALREAGYRVACTDLRGHGDSDATFSSYGDEQTADDVAALIGELGGPAVIVGNSMAAGSAVLAAAQRPGLVSGLILVGPFVRNPTVGAACALFCALPWPRCGRPSPGSPTWRSRNVPRWLVALFFAGLEVAQQMGSFGPIVVLYMLPFAAAMFLLAARIWQAAAESASHRQEPATMPESSL